MAATRYPPHFSEPWKLSDVVLVVEDQRFHVHRGVLEFWSPVFERMLSAEFKEKDSGEISLPEKKASEFEEMLQMMYPSLEEKLISQRNCYFLFELAHEYQIDSIAQKSVKLMVSMVKNRTEDDVLSMLIYAQKYAIKSLISTCIYEARRLTLKQLKKHGKRDQIEPDNYMQIAEGIIQRLEGQCQDTKVTCQEKLQQVSFCLCNRQRPNIDSYNQSMTIEQHRRYRPKPQTTATNLRDLKNNLGKLNLDSDTLSFVADTLLEVNAKIESLSP